MDTPDLSTRFEELRKDLDSLEVRFLKSSNKQLDQIVDINKVVTDLRDQFPATNLRLEVIRNDIDQLIRAVDALQAEHIDQQISTAFQMDLQSEGDSTWDTKTNQTGARETVIKSKHEGNRN